MMLVGFGSLFLALAVLWLGRKGMLKRGYQEEGPFDVVVVAGARVTSDGRPSRALNRRVACGVRCLQEGTADQILFTGGPYRGRRSEAEVARAVAVSAGLDPRASMVEEWSVSTRGNARSAYHRLGDQRVLIVTDTYHAKRAKMEFSRWFETVGVASPDNAPYPGVLVDLREQLARLWSAWRPAEGFGSNGVRVVRSARPWELEACMALRRRVFQEEGGVPAAIEADGLDAEAQHWLGLDGGRVVATARARSLGEGLAKVERVAVAQKARGSDWGRRLMERVHADLRERGFRTAKLHAQVSVAGFYERVGYQPHGEVFVEADIQHQEMRRVLRREELEAGA